MKLKVTEEFKNVNFKNDGVLMDFEIPNQPHKLFLLPNTFP